MILNGGLLLANPASPGFAQTMMYAFAFVALTSFFRETIAPEVFSPYFMGAIVMPLVWTFLYATKVHW
jgi:hypothetical protein